MLPEGWKRVTVEESCSVVSVGIVVNPSHYYVEETEGIRAFRSQNVRENRVNEQNWAYISAEGQKKNAKSILKSGDVVVVRTGFAGTACVVPPHLEGSNCIDILFARPKPEQLLPEYLCELTNSDPGRRQVLNGQSGLAQKHLNVSAYEKLSFPLPPIAEQRRQIELFGTWNEAISTTEKLLANSRRQKQIVSQALLSGRRRLTETEPWAKRTLSDLIVESRLPGSTGAVARKITVKLYGKGVIAKGERRAGSDSTRYYRRVAGQFIYSKLDFLNGAFGVIPPELDGYESTLDLPAFDFHPEVDRRWFFYYVSREDFYQGHLGLANGGRKARRVNPQDLLRVAISVPTLPEQQAIADAIDVAIADEKAWLTMLAALKAEKRALMQQLLTGRRRVRLA